ncbi:hypothetical protein FACS1894125_7310 [Actinomycetota bacterium]|nr:hypothetical protein FACS1894125_7310 [Actinomycetota bacterium]
MGLDLSSGIKLFLRQTVLQRKLPMKIYAPEIRVNDELKESFKEIRSIKNKNHKKQSTRAMFAEIGV